MKLTSNELEKVVNKISLSNDYSSSYRGIVNMEKMNIQHLILKLPLCFLYDDLFFDETGYGDGRSILIWLWNVSKTLSTRYLAH